MNDSNSSSNPTSSRVTLKLKGAARKPSAERKAPLIPRPQIKPNRPQIKPNVKPDAHWSDEYKQRMQADMDALTRK
jgi:hypothetical protein